MDDQPVHEVGRQEGCSHGRPAIEEQRFEFHMDANRTSTGRSGTSLGLEADLGTAVGAASVGAKGPAFGVYLLAGFMHY